MTSRVRTARHGVLLRVASGALVLSAAVMAGTGGARATTGSTSKQSSAVAAYGFLDQQMDRYATGSTPRLVQSFDGGGLPRFTDSETYDDALIVDALLARGTADDVARARVIGDALLYIQAHDPNGDGRIRVAYAPTPLTDPDRIKITDKTSDVGNMAWVAQSLVQLYARTGVPTYLAGAEAMASWIQANTRDTRGAGGYTGGITASGAKITWKSTEHNLDLFSLFSLLAIETGKSVWTQRAAWARHFVAAMWNDSGGFFWVGTGADGIAINTDVKAEDVNSWSYLALQDRSYAAAMDWAIAHLSVTSGAFSGLSFCTGDRGGVWFEGTAHMADALEVRNASGDDGKAHRFLDDLGYAQTNGLNHDGHGIIAASKNGLSDCDGDKYFASLHTGATSWYLLALEHADPFGLLPASVARRGAHA